MMNERIKKLAEQASTFAFTEYPKQTMATFNTNKSVDQLFNQKFAELIVRECVELIDNKVTITAAQTYDEVFVARYDTKELCAKQIREHFGVDE